MQLQKELFADAPFNMIFVDFNQSDTVSYEYFEKQCQSALNAENTDFSFDKYVGSHEKELFGICIMGMDKALQNKQTDTLKEIGTLLEKHAQLSLVFITETNFPDAPFFQDLVAKSILVGNMTYEPLFPLRISRFS